MARPRTAKPKAPKPKKSDFWWRGYEDIEIYLNKAIERPEGYTLRLYSDVECARLRSRIHYYRKKYRSFIYETNPDLPGQKARPGSTLFDNIQVIYREQPDGSYHFTMRNRPTYSGIDEPERDAPPELPEPNVQRLAKTLAEDIDLETEGPKDPS